MSLSEMEVMKMREVFFRGKQIDNGEWVEGFYLKYVDGGCTISVPQPDNSMLQYIIEPSTAEQFTGLTDKNGTKIFEGDILRAHHDNSEKTLVGIVKYGRYTDDEGEGEWDYLGWYIDVSGYCSSVLIPESLDIAIEVIGNIHDNPELIGGAEK